MPRFARGIWFAANTQSPNREDDTMKPLMALAIVCLGSASALAADPTLTSAPDSDAPGPSSTDGTRPSGPPSVSIAAQPAGPPAHPLFSGLGFGALISVNQQPSLVLVGSYDSLLFGAGVQLSYNSQGVPDSDGMATSHKVLASGTVGLQYMLYNRHPVALGPEIDYTTSLAPGDPFRVHTVSGGAAFWYAPFNAPVLVGGAWLAAVSHTSGAATTLDLMSPSLRLVLVFP